MDDDLIKVQKVPSMNESMQSDALVASELNHMAATKQAEEALGAPKPSTSPSN